MEREKGWVLYIYKHARTLHNSKVISVRYNDQSVVRRLNLVAAVDKIM